MTTSKYPDDGAKVPSGPATRPTDAPPDGRMYKWGLAALILFALYLAFRVFSPFLHPVIFSVVLAAIFHPLNKRFERMFKGRETLAALAVLGVVVVCVFLPTALFLTGLVTQAAQSMAELNAWIKGNDLQAMLDKIGVESALVWLQAKLPFLELEGLDIRTSLLKFSRTVGQGMIGMGAGLAGNAVSIFFHFLIMLFILFFLLRDGRRMVAYIRFLSPLHGEQEDQIIANLTNVSRAVLVGGLLVALLQGVAGGVGLALVGIPALFWGTMMGFASLVPVVGTGLIWVPATAWLLVTAQWKAALFLFLWSAVGVTSIDTFLRPYFMRGGTGMSTLFIFLSVIGGLQVFGPAGILYGPLVLGFAMVMLRLYGEEYEGQLSPEIKEAAKAADASPNRNTVKNKDRDKGRTRDKNKS